MVSEDLNKITKKFYIFTGNKDLAIKLGFEKNLMPYTEVFDGLTAILEELTETSHNELMWIS